MTPTDRALALLLIMALRHHAWSWVDAPMRGLASKALGSVATLALLAMLCLPAERRQWPVLLVAGWYAVEELQVVVGCALYALRPWPVAEGQPIVSALVGIRLEAIGLAVVAWLAHRIWSSADD